MLTFEAFAERLQRSFGLTRLPVPEDGLLEDLEFDSLHLLELWVMLETVAQRPLDPAMIDGLVTVEDLFHATNQFLAERR